ncbi:hypothetical protein PUR57_17955 [Streptomyces sp. JV176]|uniref:hypothetical protein n=1 Tax=Streptomyces sp. JV176 TaxID=858630 RepID=UPI002E77270B|nr:hypothetical protein [Streptomyces sp. JV176]MEE1800532.1 hypothetical protein [Streptomyces sp. JV176]
MGIESDQLVYDYLSRVGDAAQQQHLPSGDRMRLVSTLRNEIDKQRGKFGTDSPAAVRRILGRLGEPHVVVREAARRDGDTAAARAPDAPEVAVPVQRSGLAKGLGLLGPKGSREPTGSRDVRGAKAPKESTEPRPPEPSESPEPPEPSRPPEAPPTAPPPVAPPPVAPSAAPEDVADTAPAAGPGPRIPAQASDSPATPAASAPAPPRTPPRAPRQPDWWRIEQGPPGPAGMADLSMESTHGFVGGVEIPAMLKPPPKKTAKPAEATDPESAADGADGAGTEAAEAPEETESGTPRRRRLRLRPRPRPAKAKGNGLSNPFLLLAAALLVAGAFLGSWLALGGGWLLAYASRTLSRAEAKWAVFGLPGVSAAGGLVWIWGRTDGRWGEVIPKDGMAEALTGVWPVVLRTAAVSSALYLVWRARRKTAR